tara:strand:+ start:3778 stop:5373 length:1596 start_codon:yes stop_codon:yes gene_type:complete
LATTALDTGEREGEWSSRAAPTIVRESDTVDEGPDPMIGRVLSGLYKVDSRIGEGGMGTVYMAFHVHLERPFAVKVLSERVAANKQAVDRLLQEAKAASSIDHDNIVDVVSFDATEDGKVFLVMEMLEGTSLADIVERGPMRLERALPIAFQVCEALHAAHERSIVHRDLKPDNVFIVRKADADFVKVLDFGISKVKTAEAEQVRMTRTGQLVGTPLYMSPEQAKGETDVDRRADIYALGVMLFEMLAGTPPFEGSNYFQLLWKHGNEAPPALTDRRPDLPPAVAAVVMRALAKSPADRFQTMAEMEAALMAAAPEIGTHPSRLVSLPPRTLPATPTATPTSTPTPTPTPAVAAPSPRPAWVWGLAGALLAVAGVGAFAASGAFGSDPAPVTEPVTESATPPRVPEESTEAEAQSTETQPTEPTQPEPTPTEELPSGEAPPTRVQVAIESVPPGASVAGPDGEVLGTTPLRADLPTDDAVTLRFSRRGYLPHEEQVRPVEGGSVSVRLRPRPRRGSSDPSSSSSSSIRTDL